MEGVGGGSVRTVLVGNLKKRVFIFTAKISKNKHTDKNTVRRCHLRLRKSDCLEVLGLDGRIILTWISEE